MAKDSPASSPPSWNWRKVGKPPSKADKALRLGPCENRCPLEPHRPLPPPWHHPPPLFPSDEKQLRHRRIFGPDPPHQLVQRDRDRLHPAPPHQRHRRRPQPLQSDQLLRPRSHLSQFFWQS